MFEARPLKSWRAILLAQWVLHASQGDPRSQHQARAIFAARLVVVGNFLDQLNDGPLQAIMINSRERLQQPIGMWVGELVKNRLL